MTETERKALALMDIVRLERSQPPHHAWLDRKRKISHEALCRLIDAHEAFQQEVSDAVVAFMMDKPGLSGAGITRFIIAKPDPLVEALAAEIERLRAALTQIARLRTDLRGDFSLGSYQSDIARKALGETE